MFECEPKLEDMCGLSLFDFSYHRVLKPDFLFHADSAKLPYGLFLEKVEFDKREKIKYPEKPLESG